MKIYFDYLSQLKENKTKNPAKQLVKESKKLNESATDLEPEIFDIDEFIDWLGDHQQAYNDCKDYFGDDINDIDKEDLISWLADHEQLSADWKRYLGESKKRMNESFDYDKIEEVIQDYVLGVLIHINTMYDEGYEGYRIKVNYNDDHLIQEIADYLEQKLGTKAYVNEDHEIEIWPE